MVNPIYQQYWDIDHPVASKVPPFQDRFLRLSLTSLQLFALRKEAAAEALEVRPMGGDIPGEAWGKRWKHVGKVVKHMGKHGKNLGKWLKSRDSTRKHVDKWWKFGDFTRTHGGNTVNSSQKLQEFNWKSQTLVTSNPGSTKCCLTNCILGEVPSK